MNFSSEQYEENNIDRICNENIINMDDIYADGEFDLHFQTPEKITNLPVVLKEKKKINLPIPIKNLNLLKPEKKERTTKKKTENIFEKILSKKNIFKSKLALQKIRLPPYSEKTAANETRNEEDNTSENIESIDTLKKIENEEKLLYSKIKAIHVKLCTLNNEINQKKKRIHELCDIKIKILCENA